MNYYLFCFALVWRNNQGVQGVSIFDVPLCGLVFFYSEYDEGTTGKHSKSETKGVRATCKV